MLERFILESIARMNDPVIIPGSICRVCKTKLIDISTGLPSKREILGGRCDDCRNNKNKICDCGRRHQLPVDDCLECFLKKRKEEKNAK